MFRQDYDPYQQNTTNRNSHTTSTKCQYKADVWYPRWCVFVEWQLQILHKAIDNMIPPTITWIPWTVCQIYRLFIHYSISLKMAQTISSTQISCRGFVVRLLLIKLTYQSLNLHKPGSYRTFIIEIINYRFMLGCKLSQKMLLPKRFLQFSLFSIYLILEIL